MIHVFSQFRSLLLSDSLMALIFESITIFLNLFNMWLLSRTRTKYMLHKCISVMNIIYFCVFLRWRYKHSGRSVRHTTHTHHWKKERLDRREIKKTTNWIESFKNTHMTHYFHFCCKKIVFRSFGLVWFSLSQAHTTHVPSTHK